MELRDKVRELLGCNCCGLDGPGLEPFSCWAYPETYWLCKTCRDNGAEPGSTAEPDGGSGLIVRFCIRCNEHPK